MQQVKKILNMTTDSEIMNEYVCNGCGKNVQVIRMKMLFGPQKGEWFETKKGCDCEVIDLIRQQQQETKKVRLTKIFEENSLINPSLKQASFDNFEPSEFEHGLEKAKRYVDEFDIRKPKSILFQGSFGTGKSHLSVSIAKALTDKGFTTIFISTPKLLTKIRNTYNKNSEHGEEKIINSLAGVDLVVFDDIGAEGESSGWAVQKLFEIIDLRAGKHNIYTTNLSSAEFEITKDLQRIFSRMMMDAEPVIMNGMDFRKRNFLKGAKSHV